MDSTAVETQRLVMRRISPSDLDAMHAVYGDPEGMRWVGDGKSLDRAACERWIEITAKNYETRGYGMFAIVERATGEAIGFCGLVHPGGQTDAEMKYAFRRDAWGKGFGREAAPALLAYGASVHGLRRIIATAAPENEISHRILLRCGMTPAAPRHNDDGTTTLVFEWSAPGTAGA